MLKSFFNNLNELQNNFNPNFTRGEIKMGEELAVNAMILYISETQDCALNPGYSGGIR